LLIGGGGNDILEGGAGNDRLAGGDGDDILEGGAGDDTLYGDLGSDTYLFGRGDGHDTISESSWIPNETDRIQLKEGISPNDIRLERVCNLINGWQPSDDLVLTIRDTGETIIVRDHFTSSYVNRSIEEIVFADGTVWDIETIKTLVLLGEAGNDTLRGFDNRDDTIIGGAGDDLLQGLSGNDTLMGGAGNDRLEGGDGDDILDGGYGNDTYRFGRGDGHDVIRKAPSPSTEGLGWGWVLYTSHSVMLRHWTVS
jgi:Ca2+-binding RTX toxin-like protein